MADYWSRIRDQEQVYDTLSTEEKAPFVKVMNVGERIEVNRIEGESVDNAHGSPRLPAISMLLFPHEHSHQTPHNLLCKGASRSSASCAHSQSGQSLIEHSYKADSDLSPAGWEYAERLKAAVTARRKAVREERKARGEPATDENPLLVSEKD